jgi:hypothetical protein
LYLSREFYKNVTRTIFTNEINQFSLSALKKTDLFAGGEQPFCRQKNAAGSPFLKPGRSRPNLPNSSFFLRTETTAASARISGSIPGFSPAQADLI